MNFSSSVPVIPSFFSTAIIFLYSLVACTAAAFLGFLDVTLVSTTSELLTTSWSLLVWSVLFSSWFSWSLFTVLVWSWFSWLLFTSVVFWFSFGCCSLFPGRSILSEPFLSLPNFLSKACLAFFFASCSSQALFKFANFFCVTSWVRFPFSYTSRIPFQPCAPSTLIIAQPSSALDNWVPIVSASLSFWTVFLSSGLIILSLVSGLIRSTQ